MVGEVVVVTGPGYPSSGPYSPFPSDEGRVSDLLESPGFCGRWGRCTCEGGIGLPVLGPNRRHLSQEGFRSTSDLTTRGSVEGG